MTIKNINTTSQGMNITGKKPTVTTSGPTDGFKSGHTPDDDIIKMRQLAASTAGKAAGVMFSDKGKQATKDMKEVKKVVLSGKSYRFKAPQVWFVDKNGSAGDNAVYDRKNKILYTGVGSVDKQYLIAFNADGSVRWAHIEEECKGKPVVDKEGSVYFRSSKIVEKDGHKQAECLLNKMDKDGNRIWSFPVPNGFRNSVAPAIGPDGMVYVIGADREKYSGKESLYAVKDGKEVWAHKLDTCGVGKPSILPGSKGTVYVTGRWPVQKKGMAGWLWNETEEKPFLKGLDVKTGRKTCSRQVKNWPSWTDSGVVESPDGSILAIHNNSRKLSCYTPDLQHKWTYDLKDKVKVEHSTSEGTLRRRPEFDADGNVYLATDGVASYPEGYLIKLDKNGNEIFNETIKGGTKSPAHIASDGKVYVQSNDGENLVFNPDGSRAGELEPGKMAAGNPMPEEADSLLHINEKDGVILFQPNFEKVLEKIDRSIVKDLVTPGVTDKDDKKGIIEKDDVVIIGGVKLEINKAAQFDFLR